MENRIITAFLLAILVVACGDSDISDDGPEAVFTRYRKALLAQDLDGLSACLVESVAAELKERGPEALAFVAAFVPKDVTVEGVTVDGDRAVVRLSQGNGEPTHGRVRLVRVDGRWRVEKEHWGTEDAAPEPKSEKVPAPDPADGEYRFDLAGKKIPDRIASGRLGGKPFAVSVAEIQNNILTLADGDLFDQTGQFLVFLFLHDKKPLPGRTIELGPKPDFSAPVGAHVHVHWKAGENKTEMDSKVEGFALRLVFGQPKDGKLPGRIWLTYPDEAKSFVAGTFTAEMK